MGKRGSFTVKTICVILTIARLTVLDVLDLQVDYGAPSLLLGDLARLLIEHSLEEALQTRLLII